MLYESTGIEVTRKHEKTPTAPQTSFAMLPGLLLSESGEYKKKKSDDQAWIGQNASGNLVAFVCDGVSKAEGGFMADRIAYQIPQSPNILEGIKRGWQDAKRQAPDVTTASTATAVEIIVDKKDPNKRTAQWAHVGDSRLYLQRKGVLTQITTDHRVENSSRLTQAVTSNEEHIDIQTGEFKILPGDILLLVTDGVERGVSNQDLPLTLYFALQSPDPARYIAEKSQKNQKKDKKGRIDDASVGILKFS